MPRCSSGESWMSRVPREIPASRNLDTPRRRPGSASRRCLGFLLACTLGMVACQRDEPADPVGQTPVAVRPAVAAAPAAPVAAVEAPDDGDTGTFAPDIIQIGRASFTKLVFQYVLLLVFAVSL